MKKINKLQVLYIVYLALILAVILSFCNINTAESIKNVAVFLSLTLVTKLLINRASVLEKRKRCRSRKIRRYRRRNDGRI